MTKKTKKINLTSVLNTWTTIQKSLKKITENNEIKYRLLVYDPVSFEPTQYDFSVGNLSNKKSWIFISADHPVLATCLHENIEQPTRITNAYPVKEKLYDYFLYISKYPEVFDNIYFMELINGTIKNDE